ncbi:MAG TPA: sulfatase, partial [Flavobacteriaceae bacterium]|nr:sulfatase [Flavobacteriaceae bacterium]
MKKVTFLLIVFLSFASFAQDKPNILIIHTDDLGYHDLSITGSQLYDTPNIDNLAKESVNFTNAYSSYPRCTPSRYGMITGTYPVNENKGFLGGIPEEKNFVKQFNNAGYNTLYVGKWHLGEGKSSPKNFGFKESYAAGRAGGLGSRFYPFNYK